MKEALNRIGPLVKQFQIVVWRVFRTKYISWKWIEPWGQTKVPGRGGGFYTSLFYLVTIDHSPIFHKSLYFFLTGRHAGVHDYDVHGFLAVRPVRSLHPDLLSLPYLRHRADV